jgi:hypothetical protein
MRAVLSLGRQAFSELSKTGASRRLE